MSSVNYSLKHKGIRLIDSQDAWIVDKRGNTKLNPKYKFVGKIDSSMPNMIISASDKSKPKYKGSTYDLNRVAKGQIIKHFYDENGKRNRKKVAYFAIEKKNKNSNIRRKK